MRRIAASLLALCPAVATAQDRPPLTPTRDVDVVYMMVREDAPGGPAVVEERMRWAVAAGKLRVDPPTPGMWVVMDTHTRLVFAVRDAERSVLELPSGQTTPVPAPSAAAPFRRLGPDSVAGVACTDWQTTDVTGAATRACITADGVLLRAASGPRVLVEALRVAYAPQDASVFAIPDDYRRMIPPALKRPPP